MKNFIKTCIQDFKKVPSLLVCLSAIATLLMNILANKTLFSNSNFFSVDCGIVVSWIMFLIMDTITQKYGGKASFSITIFDVVLVLLASVIMSCVACVPESSFSGWFVPEATALNNLIGNNYLVVLTSLFAFVCASIVDIASNLCLSKLLKKSKILQEETEQRTIKSFFVYFFRAYGSTLLSQFVDNLIFMIIAYPLLFNMPCSISSILLGAFFVSVAEMITQLIFAPIGYISTLR